MHVAIVVPALRSVVEAPPANLSTPDVSFICWCLLSCLSLLFTKLIITSSLPPHHILIAMVYFCEDYVELLTRLTSSSHPHYILSGVAGWGTPCRDRQLATRPHPHSGAEQMQREFLCMLVCPRMLGNVHAYTCVYTCPPWEWVCMIIRVCPPWECVCLYLRVYVSYAPPSPPWE